MARSRTIRSQPQMGISRVARKTATRITSGEQSAASHVVTNGEAICLNRAGMANPQLPALFPRRASRSPMPEMARPIWSPHGPLRSVRHNSPSTGDGWNRGFRSQHLQPQALEAYRDAFTSHPARLVVIKDFLTSRKSPIAEPVSGRGSGIQARVRRVLGRGRSYRAGVVEGGRAGPFFSISQARGDASTVSHESRIVDLSAVPQGIPAAGAQDSFSRQSPDYRWAGATTSGRTR